MRIKDLLSKTRALDTLEKKSFWMIGPIVVLIGLLSIITTLNIYSSVVVLFSAGLCVVTSILIMYLCVKSGNYHIYYPTLCMVVSALLVPISFLINGGFNSGMPVFCAGATILCAFCYERKWRFISFGVALLSNLGVFFYSKFGYGTMNPVESNYVENDIILSYIMVSIGLFFILNMVIDEARVFEKGSEVLSAYVDSEVKELLFKQANNGKLNLEGSSIKVSVLFVDISRFTSATENMDPGVAAKYLNTFLQIADECVHDNGGIIDKFIGDCVMAYWPDPYENGNGVYSSVKTVMDIRKRLYSASGELFEEFKQEMDFSAGIEYGDVVLGNIGSERRKDYTIIGDAVNTASRIQALASRSELLVSDNVEEKIRGQFDLTPITETHYLRGKNKPLVLYRVNSIIEGTADASLSDKSQKNRLKKDKEPNQNGYVLTICGCRGSFPVSGIRYSEFGGETSCYVIKHGKYAIVVDCGTGLSNAKNLLADCTDIDILITHVHYDHIMGLLDTAVFPKDANIRLFGHFGGWAGKNTINDFIDAPYWPVNLRPMQTEDVIIGKEYNLNELCSAVFIKSDHPNGGTVIRLLIGNKKICFFSDLENPSYINPEYARNADLLFYDGMYDDSNIEQHKGWGHSTWQQAVSYALEEKVVRLIVTHHNPELADRSLMKYEAEAKSRFSETVYARSGDIFNIL